MKIANYVATGLLLIAISSPSSATTIHFDYRFDSGFFAAGSSARDTLEAAAAAYQPIISDSLESIDPSGGNFWMAEFTDPSTGLQTAIVDLVVPADTLVIFVGSRDLTGAAIGSAGPGSYFSSGTAAWNATVSARGQGATSGSSANDFGPWGGTVVVDELVTWNLNHADAPQDGENDLFSVLIHELGHVFGVGTADSWFNQTESGRFIGPAAVSNYSAPVPLMGDDAHWLDGVMSQVVGTGVDQEAAFDPSIMVGTRKTLTTLDVAALADVGWQVVPEPTAGTLACWGTAVLAVFRRMRRR